MAEKEKLMEDYRRMLHVIAMARNPLEAETALRIAQNIITMLESKTSDREILDMRETVYVFYWKAARRMAEGI